MKEITLQTVELQASEFYQYGDYEVIVSKRVGNKYNVVIQKGDETSSCYGLTCEQIKQVNESGMLPKNAKFYSNGMGGYTLGNNFFNISTGTRQLPAGYELQKNLLGFTVVVPKGSDGLFVNKAE